MSLEKMNSKIESFTPTTADPNKIAECWSKLIEVLESGSAKDLQIVCIKYGALLGYKRLNYMLEALYHGVTPAWVDGSVVIEPSTTQQEVKPAAQKPWWA